MGILRIIPWTNHRMASLAYDHCFLVSCGPLGTQTSSRNLSFTFGRCHFHSYYGLSIQCPFFDSLIDLDDTLLVSNF